MKKLFNEHLYVLNPPINTWLTFALACFPSFFNTHVPPVIYLTSELLRVKLQTPWYFTTECLSLYL